MVVQDKVHENSLYLPEWRWQVRQGGKNFFDKAETSFKSVYKLKYYSC